MRPVDGREDSQLIEAARKVSGVAPKDTRIPTIRVIRPREGLEY